MEDIEEKEKEGMPTTRINTEDIEKAEKWVNKFNARVEYWKEILKQYSDEDGFLDEKYYRSPVSRWFWKIKDINNGFFDEIELR